MSSINEFKDQINITTSKLFWLSIATVGIYSLLWLYEKYKIIDRETKRTTASDAYVIWIAACVGFSGVFSSNDFTSDTQSILGGLLSLSAWIMTIIWGFRARRALQEYALAEHRLDLKLNGVLTFLFPILYINYSINNLPEVQRRQEALRGQSQS